MCVQILFECQINSQHHQQSRLDARNAHTPAQARSKPPGLSPPAPSGYRPCTTPTILYHSAQNSIQFGGIGGKGGSGGESCEALCRFYQRRDSLCDVPNHNRGIVLEPSHCGYTTTVTPPAPTRVSESPRQPGAAAHTIRRTAAVATRLCWCDRPEP